MNLYDKTGSGDISFDEFKALVSPGGCSTSLNLLSLMLVDTTYIAPSSVFKPMHCCGTCSSASQTGWARSPAACCLFGLQASDGVLLKGKLGEYADAFSAVDKDGNGEFCAVVCLASRICQTIPAPFSRF